MDFTYSFEFAGSLIPGFHNCHSGFLGQLFRRQNPAPPYEIIAQGLSSIAHTIRAKTGVERVNLWVTGHSLGAGMASLFMAKARTQRLENLVLRDAYLFGTPIVCDPASLAAFNQSVLYPPIGQEDIFPLVNVWRVQNRKDAVSTLLPDLGDNTKLGQELSPLDQANFAHLGQLMRMRTLPKKARFGSGTLLPIGEPITITSALPNRGCGPEIPLSLFGRALQYLPFPLGR